jgi:hypothetical protein
MRRKGPTSSKKLQKGVDQPALTGVAIFDYYSSASDSHITGLTAIA